MTLKNFIVKKLYENGDLSLVSLVDMFYEECPDKIERKRGYYISKGNEKTEKELKQQVLNEFSRERHRLSQLSLINYDKISIKITDIGKKFYTDNFNDTLIDDEFINECSDEYISDDDVSDIIISGEKGGFVYLLKSDIYPDTYKIGKTKNINQRIGDLIKDHRYGIFGLREIMRIECDDYSIIERVLHKFFEDYRLCKKNDIKVDTELFKGNESIEIEFELFADFLIKNPRYKNSCKLVKNS